MPTVNSAVVYVNGRFLGQRLTGIQRYARETLLALDGLLADGALPGATLPVVLLVPLGTPVPVLRAIRVEPLGPLNGHAWEQWTLPRRVGHSLLLSFSATGPLFKRRQIVTVHDASVARVPDAFKPAFRHWYALQTRLFGRRVARMLTVSQFSAGELQQCFGVQPERLSVTSEGWQHLLPVAERVRAAGGGKRWSERPFVLAVSSPTPNKNFAAVARAALDPRVADVEFLIAGARDGAVFEAVTAAATPPNVRFLGYVSDEDLCSLYDQAACFVFPSRYEGFGLPLIEAMSRGCPVVASDIASTREVAGDAVQYFPLAEPLVMVARIRALVDDPALAARHREAGLRRAERFSWTEAARLTWAQVLSALPAPFQAAARHAQAGS